MPRSQVARRVTSFMADADAVAVFLGGVAPPPTADAADMSAGAVPRSVLGLEQLSRAHAWAAVLELSASLLSADDDAGGGGLAPQERLSCAAHRAMALLQTRQVERAHDACGTLGALAEEDAFGDNVPFELRAVAAEARVRLPGADAEAAEALYALRKACANRATGDDKHVWKAREAQVLSTVAAHHLRIGQHDAAVDAAREIVRLQKHEARALYMYVRVLLHVGDLDAATDALAMAHAKNNDSEPLRALHDALLLAARGRYEEAAAIYATVVRLCESVHHDGTAYERNLWTFATNNWAICLLHLGRAEEAIRMLEQCLRKDARMALDEGIVVNVATLYDLTSPDTAAEKKAVLKALASKYARQGFDLNVISVS